MTSKHEENKAARREGIALGRARRLSRELPHLTPEQLILCIAPDWDDERIGRGAGRIEVMLGIRPIVPKLPTTAPRTNPGIWKRTPSSRGRRIVRKGTEMT